MNRNGATGLWMGTYPFASRNAAFPLATDVAGLKAIGAGIVLKPTAPATIADQSLVPKDKSFDVPTSINLQVAAVSGATSYRLQLSTSSNFQSTNFDSTNNLSVPIFVGGLLTNTTYYWRVYAINAGGISDWSNVWSFTTWNKPDFWTAVLPPIGNGIWETETSTSVPQMTLNSYGDLFAIVSSYSSTRDHIYRSTDNGYTWSDINNGLPVSSYLNIQINSQDYIFVGSSGFIARSNDNGNSWTQLNNGSYYYDLVINSKGYLFANIYNSSTGRGIYRSTDNGDSWSIVGMRDSTFPSGLWLDKPGNLYTRTYYAIYKSTDDGINWSTFYNKGYGTSGQYDAQLFFNSKNYIFVKERNGSKYIFLRSKDNGSFWTQLDTNISYGKILIAQNDVIYSVSSIATYHSTDHGDTWVQLGGGINRQNIYTLLINKNGDIFARSEKGYLFKAKSVSDFVPNIDLNSSIIPYGNVTIGNNNTQTLTISNTGNANLIISSISISGNDQSMFTYSGATIPATITAGSNINLSIKFTPGSTGNKSASLQITHNASGSPTSVSLTGTGVVLQVPNISLSSAGISFGSVTVNNSNSQTFTISNTGNADLIISNISISGTDQSIFTISGITAPKTIQSGSKTDVTITFTPTSIGTKTASLQITHNASGSPSTINLSGISETAKVPNISLSSSGISFGSVTVGNINNQTLTISNTGNADLIINNISLSGTDQSMFTYSGVSVPANITAGNSVNINITFTPGSTGSKTALLTISHNASGSSNNVSLTGIGTSIPTPNITLSSSSINFANVNEGESGNQSFSITNSGNADLIINSITITGSDLSLFTVTGITTPKTVPSGNKVDLTIKFSPLNAGTKTATIQITHNATGSTSTVSLSGIGVAKPKIVLNSSSLTYYAMQNQSSPASQTITITNGGGGTLDWSISSPQTWLIVNPGSGTSNNATVTVSINSTNLSPGMYNPSLTVTASNATGSPATISVKYYIIPSTINLSKTYSFENKAANEYTGKEYQLIGLPGNYNQPVTSLLKGEKDKDWKILWDNGSTGTDIVKYDASDNFKFTAGRAFILLNKGPWSVSANSVSMPSPNSSQEIEIPLHSGWNLITNPYSSTIQWTAMQQSNSMSVPIYSLNSDNSWSYSQSQLFEPYIGYYFDNKSISKPSLKIPLSLLSGTSIAKSENLLKWKIGIDLVSGDFRDRTTYLGVSEKAIDGIDEMDYRKPKLFDRIPGVYFSKNQNNETDIYATDIRQEFEGNNEWEFEAKTNKFEKTSLIFTGTNDLPDNFNIYMIDVDRGKAINLREDTIYNFIPVREKQKFRIVIGKEAEIKNKINEITTPTGFKLGNNYPNPFNMTTNIPIILERESYITLAIYNVIGEEVKVIYSGMLPEGRYIFDWDARNDNGQIMTSGIYFSRLRTNKGIDESNKMILMK